ncbi:NUDIX hydrolase [Tenggerimyces flavus]|uniref:NUDIX hydrolase n=1 Tax=Tenggerimyces flavus TaxID=1708749 RepID=A0ABV7Y9I1_9ACTN|nr:NUDIX domain-containing protein [Tenggerimyces flavus]MBM7783778.1 ADP-ribose pyrophosphatase YjhB (NUDIX family) [Tenggerimyces flavus]
MRASVRTIHQLIAAIPPLDGLEAEHQTQALRWLERTDDVFRRVKPATPSPHLVAYTVLVDPADRSSLLVHHRNAGLWLPPGGHVEPDEYPADAADREVREELGIVPRFADPARRPAFVTVTETVGIDHGHTDVSLWFLLLGERDLALTTDLAEFTEARWWSPAEVRAAEAGSFDPHYARFSRKVTAGLVWDLDAPIGLAAPRTAP